MAQDSNYVFGTHTAFQRLAEGGASNAGLAVDSSLKISTPLPSYHELAKAGRVYVASSATATGKAPVTAVPTTAAIFALWNGNPSGLGGLSLVILGLSYFHLAGTTSGLGASLIAGVSPTSQGAVTTATNAIIKSTSCSTRTTGATFGTDITLGGTPAWMNFGGDTIGAVSAPIGAGVHARIDGLFIVPPGFALGMSVLAPTGTAHLFGMTVMYAEIETYLV